MSLFERLAEFFEQDDWKIVRKGDGALELEVQMENGAFTCTAEAREGHGQVFFETACPFRIPAGKRIVVCEFMARANMRLAGSHFTLNLEDGALAVKSGLLVTSADDLTEQLLDPLVYFNLAAADHFLPAVGAVCFADVAPRVAVDAVTEIWTLEHAMRAASAALDDDD